LTNAINKANSKTFTFGEATINSPQAEDNGETIKTPHTLLPSYDFIGVIASAQSQSNT